MNFPKMVAGAIFALGTMGSAHAALGYCNTYLAPLGAMIQTDGLAVTDMIYNGSNAANCYGKVSGNDNSGLGTLWGGGWTLTTKSDENSDTGVILNGINFDVEEQNTGLWTLSGVGTPLPQFFDFVGVLKQGGGNNGGYAAYLFDDVVFNGTNDGGTYVISFTSPPTLDVSHISIYARTGDDPSDPPVVIPEPASLALAGLALAAMGAMTRRRRST